MPKKARPAPLAESIFHNKLVELQSEEKAHNIADLPVHNTFIQFDSPTAAEATKQKILTAPAWIGTASFSSVANSAMNAAIQASTTQSPHSSENQVAPSLPDTADSESSLRSDLWMLSPKKIQVPSYTGSGSGEDALPGSVPKSQEQAAEGEPTRHAPRGPLAKPGEMPSIGSAKHNDGLCKRCCFFPKGRCTNGFDCEFCHLEHDKRKRKKKKKSRSKAQDDDDDSDSGDDEQENKAPDATGKAAGAQSSPAVAEESLLNGLPPLSTPPQISPRLPTVPEAPSPLPTTYEAYSFSGGFDFSGAAVATSPLSPVSGAPLADASARVPVSPMVGQQYVDAGMGYASGFGAASPSFQPGAYCHGASPISPPPPTIPTSLQGCNAVQAGATVQNVSVLPGVGLPAPR
jgi:hypothetical protein